MAASTELREELTCSICLSIYTDPVTLRCGHNFCGICIEDTLERQKTTGVYTCPDCRAECQERPVLQRNTTLCNIAKHFMSTQPEQKTWVLCTYCDLPVSAVKSCLQCETSMCDNHLRKHDRSVDHILIAPTILAAKAKRCIHSSVGDGTIPINVCRTQKQPLEKNAERENDKLKYILQKLTAKRKKTEKRVQNLQEFRRKIQEKAAGERERAAAQFRDIRRRMEDLEKRVLGKISRQEQEASVSVSNLIQQLEIKKDELYSKILYIEELCNMTKPLPILQLETAELCDIDDGDEEDGERDVLKFFVASDADKNIISETLQSGLVDIMTGVKGGINVLKRSGILLDVNTAGNKLILSGDLQAISWTEISQNRPETPELFEYYQVLSTTRFSSGQHCWELETSKIGRWRVGMAYASIERKGGLSLLGNNKKSWCLRWCNDEFSIMHDCRLIKLPHKLSSQRIRLNLDYEAGQLSFYELCDPIRHLHTFTAAFTEPLHAAFCVWTGCMRILSSER
ncbi:E3 ubiquitin/ISG15 ligase TRIM25-like [Mixophyes fleayi]|uniref:E3 ubiquitin/ISG15 ligase TRIM25-like n=1 Tax=Mixophyes fleayi TaxID=3061075 RepID=UPI003F4E1A1D